MSLTKIFFTGATGYIGGSVLTRLLHHSQRDFLEITVLTRSSEKAKKFESFGVKAVVGSYSDHHILQELATVSDVVFACADADDLGAAQAILAGLKFRHEKTGNIPILIHTSGTGVLSDNAEGQRSTDIVYHDSDVLQMASLAPTQIHRDVDLAILDADAAGFLKAYIVLPSTIWGLATGPLFDAGISNPHSIQIPSLIKTSLARGVAGMVGEGRNMWPNVWIDDVADLYIVLFDYVVANPSYSGHGTDGYYFGANGEHVLKDVSKAIGEALVALGKAKTAEPTPFTEEEIQQYFNGSKYLGSNSRCRADHAKSIGWKPRKTTEDMLASIHAEVESIVKEGASLENMKLK
ncbi:NAD(P)-binding protein [Punctularia strigosozonata HHB-11173 SS5]|uniref:NAD(P)-binding protein n=1 Tax=Punctularia strigosozonata (strain HHB-11173) TaxID=741275 RepID=UPI00044172CF|nr:NAD(P)-binding protein [Punctularia strigosozonata HHB-11173 SS5]EIN10832.1 NAD(P)-binding protein [Punctularia strigosozonata HHB-11173 SS5]